MSHIVKQQLRYSPRRYESVCRDECDVCWTHGDERFADGRQNIGPQRVQQQLVFGQNRQQQQTRVLRTQILQQLHKLAPLRAEDQPIRTQNTDAAANQIISRRTHLSGSGDETGWQSSRLSYGESWGHTDTRLIHTHSHTLTHFHSHTHSLSHTFILTLSLSLRHSLTLTHFHSHTLTHFHSHSQTLTHFHSHTLTHYHYHTLTHFILSLSHTFILTLLLSHFHFLTHFHSHSHTFTHTLTLTHSHTITLSLSQSL